MDTYTNHRQTNAYARAHTTQTHTHTHTLACTLVIPDAVASTSEGFEDFVVGKTESLMYMHVQIGTVQAIPVCMCICGCVVLCVCGCVWKMVCTNIYPGKRNKG